MTATQYTDAEIAELQLGWLIREQDADAQRDSHEQTLRENYHEETGRMIQDIEQQQQQSAL